MRVGATLTEALRHLGPAMGTTAPRELVRAAIGAALAILLCDQVLWALRHFTPALPGGTGDPLREVIIVAPFAATAFLILTVPNSPLAQPWSVIVGNVMSALVGVISAILVPFPVLAATAAVALSVLAMAMTRSLHPPGAALALNVVLLTDAGGDTGAAFLLATVVAGSVVLVALGAVYNTATGRRYPFRQPSEALPAEAAYLTGLLERSRLSANIGVGDLARLIAAAEAEATARHLGQMRAADMMTTDIRSLPPEASVAEMRRAFEDHPYQSFPVVRDGVYLGMVTQFALIEAREGALAGDVMERGPTLSPDAEMPAILLHLTGGRVRLLPLVQGDRLIGVISRSDLIGVLARAVRLGSG